jgi:Holliday junction resolvase RusA-like endonuclease
MREFTVQLPLEHYMGNKRYPMSLNSFLGTNKYVKNKVMRSYKQDTIAPLMLVWRRLRNSGAMQAFSSEYQFTLRTRRRKDTGNYWSMIQKCFFDYLSEAGYIADDSNVQHKKETMTQTVYDKSAKFDFVTVTIREEER